ncbi:MAG: START domain-containing protein [Bacteroidetes bacterium]|nr:START domain-containing protein [Bacteroidota bacterium]
MISLRQSPLLLLFLVSSLNLKAQQWVFIKEKEGIKIYTRTPENSTFKCFKGETVFHASMEKLSLYIGNVKNFNWWDKNVKDLRVIEAEPGKHAKYYLVYDLPWPLNDRDLCVEAFITYDTLKREKVVSSKPLPGAVPEQKGIVRIKNYWQKWTLTAIDDNNVHAVLEGFVDPGGSIPSWLYNMVITETPLNVMGGIKARVEPGQSK